MLHLPRPQQLRALLLLGAVTALGACSTANGPDPWREGWNEPVHNFNESFDKRLLEPVAKGYDVVAPGIFQAAESGAGQRVQRGLKLRAQSAQPIGGAANVRALFRARAGEHPDGGAGLGQAFGKGERRLVQPKGFVFVFVCNRQRGLKAAQLARKSVPHRIWSMGRTM